MLKYLNLDELLSEENQNYSSSSFSKIANVEFLRLFGVEPNFYKRQFSGGQNKSDPLSTDQIASILENSNLVDGKEEAKQQAKFLTEGSPRPSFFIGGKAGGWTTLNDREYMFVPVANELYSLQPSHYVAPTFALG